MGLDLQPYDALDDLKTDEDLAFALDDALGTRDSAYLDVVLTLIETARNLPVGKAGTVERLLAATQAIKRDLVSSASNQDRKAA